MDGVGLRATSRQDGVKRPSARGASVRTPNRTINEPESCAVGLRLARRCIRGCSTWRNPLKLLKIAAAVGALAAASTIAVAADISGAGATFPYPIYAKWADTYKKETGVGLNYQSIGSGGGIKQVQAKTVTFGASDMPLKGAELDKDGLAQFPTVMGGVVPVVNLEGVKGGELALDGATLAKIFLGQIKTWHDPAIAKLNASVKLPAQPIVVVHRSDGSGTTFLFTDYLSKTNPDWKSKVGANTAVEW